MQRKSPRTCSKMTPVGVLMRLMEIIKQRQVSLGGSRPPDHPPPPFGAPYEAPGGRLELRSTIRKVLEVERYFLVYRKVVSVRSVHLVVFLGRIWFCNQLNKARGPPTICTGAMPAYGDRNLHGNVIPGRNTVV